MLEPWPIELSHEGPFRGLLIRQGFDLEPFLPDPAPAYLDPEGALHPALVEPLSALPLHRFPTTASRAALVAHVLSAPGRANLLDETDPFVAVYRFSARQDMEPEITGCLALVLLRSHLASHRKAHRTFRPDPETVLNNPDHDPFARQRARLRDTDWDGLWQEVQAAASFVGTDPALAFERATLKASALWLEDYRNWWDVARHVEDPERIPEDPGPLLTALNRSPVDLGDAIANGVSAEQEFMDAALTKSTDRVDADWLLAQQLRALRNLDLATREFSLELHELVRRCDVARVRAQIAYRAYLLRLWLSDDPRSVEARILALPDPPHSTTLGAGLGRLLGVILLARLRRGETEGGLELAARALHLAPEELSVRITANDLEYHYGNRDTALLRSLREERSRWDSVSVCAMGARVAGTLQDHSTSRHFGAHLFRNALGLGTVGGWAVCASEVLSGPPGHDRRVLAGRLSEIEVEKDVNDPLLHILFGPSNHAQAIEDLEFGLLDASLRDETLDGLQAQPLKGISNKRSAPAWKQLLQKSLVPVENPEFCARLWSRIQSLRAASETMRKAPLAAEIRALQELLSRAAELEVAAPPPLGELLPKLALYLHDPTPTGAKALAAWVALERDPLRIAVRRPRQEALEREIGALASQIRLGDNATLLDRLSRLRAKLADPQSDLNAIDLATGELQDALLTQPSHPETEGVSEESLMTFHPEFDVFSTEQLGIRGDALRRARGLVRLFNLSGGQRDRKRIKGTAGAGLFELRHRTTTVGGLRVFYRRERSGWLALAAMSKYDDRQQQEAIERVARYFADSQGGPV